MIRHRWERNRCTRCGLERKNTCIPNGAGVLVRGLFYFPRAGVPTSTRPECTTAQAPLFPWWITAPVCEEQ